MFAYDLHVFHICVYIFRDVLNYNNVNKEKRKKDITVSSRKKSKIESSKNHISEDNYMLGVIGEVLETLIEKLDNGNSVQSINISNISSPNPVVKDIVENIIEPQAQKTSLISLEKNVELSKEAQETREKIKPVSDSVHKSQGSQFSLSEKLYKPQKAVVSEKLGVQPKQKPKNEPKFKEKNALFKYGNYNR